MTAPTISSSARRVFLMCSLCAAALLPASADDVPAGWQTFRGNYFIIGVPPGFVATPQGDPGGGGRHDEVSLWNAELSVEFYVYSPQWNGEALIMEVGTRAEELTSSESKRTGNIEEKQLTITALDKSYTRFVVSLTNVAENTNKTFGIRVPNVKVYERIRPTYVTWKKSLTQFAD